MDVCVGYDNESGFVSGSFPGPFRVQLGSSFGVISDPFRGHFGHPFGVTMGCRFGFISDSLLHSLWISIRVHSGSLFGFTSGWLLGSLRFPFGVHFRVPFGVTSGTRLDPLWDHLFATSGITLGSLLDAHRHPNRIPSDSRMVEIATYSQCDSEHIPLLNNSESGPGPFSRIQP
jgi:hypothetical protein